MKIQFLGTGAAANLGRYNSSIIVNEKILLDCGPTTVANLKKIGLTTEDISTIFISHLHGDHFIGLPFFFLDSVILKPRQNALTLVAPKETISKVLKIAEIIYGESLKEKLLLNYPLNFIPIEGRNSDGKTPECSFQAIQTKHGEELAYNLILDFEKLKLGYSGDSEFCETLQKTASQVDVMICERTSPKEKLKGHCCGDEIELLSKMMKPSSKLILTHFVETEIQNENPNFIYPNDFDKYNF